MKFILYNEVYKAVTYRVALRETEMPLETGKDREDKRTWPWAWVGPG